MPTRLALFSSCHDATAIVHHAVLANAECGTFSSFFALDDCFQVITNKRSLLFWKKDFEQSIHPLSSHSWLLYNVNTQSFIATTNSCTHTEQIQFNSNSIQSRPQTTYGTNSNVSDKPQTNKNAVFWLFGQPRTDTTYTTLSIYYNTSASVSVSSSSDDDDDKHTTMFDILRYIICPFYAILHGMTFLFGCNTLENWSNMVGLKPTMTSEEIIEGNTSTRQYYTC